MTSTYSRAAFWRGPVVGVCWVRPLLASLRTSSLAWRRETDSSTTSEAKPGPSLRVDSLLFYFHYLVCILRIYIFLSLPYFQLLKGYDTPLILLFPWSFIFACVLFLSSVVILVFLFCFVLWIACFLLVYPSFEFRCPFLHCTFTSREIVVKANVNRFIACSLTLHKLHNSLLV